MNFNAIPVIMYHSVKYKRRKNWCHPHLSLLIESFEKHLKTFNFFGFKSFHLDNLLEHQKGVKRLPGKSLVLTFDDGYLDNWVFAYPLLKKYNIKATIFVNPEFISDKKVIRPNLENYWNNEISLEELNNYDGFLSWDEMKLMEESGLVRIESHTMSHTKYPVSTNIIDFTDSNSKIDYLEWNLFPEKKKEYLIDEVCLPVGYPILEAKEGNIAKRLKNEKELWNIVLSKKEKSNIIIDSEGIWKESLFKEIINELDNFVPEYESEEEYEKRLWYEVNESKKILEERLSKKIKFLCWPFGAWNERTIDIAQKAGYLATTAKGQSNVFRKKMYDRIDRIALDSPKYQTTLFPLYFIYKILKYKIKIRC